MKVEQKVIEYFLNLSSGGDTSTITTEKVQLVSGICTLIEVIFPPGPSGLVGVRASQGVHQLIPEANELWLVGDDITYPHGSPVDLITGSKTLLVEGYNEDETYDHTITFRFTVSIPVDDPLFLIAQLLKTRLPVTQENYGEVLAAILRENINTKMVLESYVLPILDEMNKRDETRWRSEIKDRPLTELARL